MVNGLLENANIVAEISSENEKKRGLVIKAVAQDKSQIETIRDLVKSYVFATDVS